jgi:hypothetical protein
VLKLGFLLAALIASRHVRQVTSLRSGKETRRENMIGRRRRALCAIDASLACEFERLAHLIALPLGNTPIWRG